MTDHARGLGRWWRRRGLRARVTITAAVALLIAFAAFDLLLFSVLRVSLTRSLDDSAGQSASDVVALINADRLTGPHPGRTGNHRAGARSRGPHH